MFFGRRSSAVVAVGLLVLIVALLWFRREESAANVSPRGNVAFNPQRGEIQDPPAAYPLQPVPASTNDANTQPADAKPVTAAPHGGRPPVDTTRTVPHRRPYAEADRENGGVVLKEVWIDEVISRKRWNLRDPAMIAEIFVMLGRGTATPRHFKDFNIIGYDRTINSRYTHSLYLPEIWHYDSRTGEYALFSSSMAPLYRLNDGDRALMNAILALGYASP